MERLELEENKFRHFSINHLLGITHKETLMLTALFQLNVDKLKLNRFLIL